MTQESTNVASPDPAYMSAIVGLVPAAAATDIFTISGVANKIVRVNQIMISGIATAAAAIPISIVKRTTANTAGTATTVSPVAMDSSQKSASNALIQAYTANPTLGSITNGGPIAAARMILSTASASVGSSPTTFAFERMYLKQPVLIGANESLCVNYGGITAAGNSIDIAIAYSEVSQ